MPLAPHAIQELGPWAISLSVAGIVYSSVIAIRQHDLKRLVAYSSIAHVGLIAAGLFTFSRYALQGSVIQMVSHGVNIVGMFIIIDAIERRTSTRQISELGGLARQTPVLAFFFMVILLGSIALPLTNGFVGEFLLLLGLFDYHPAFAAVAGLTIILGAVYMLWMYQRVMFGGVKAAEGEIPDLGPAELASLIPILIVILWTGIFPSTVTSIYLNDILLIFNR
jgi:NADH-quinone oxidoreductase subunit M